MYYLYYVQINYSIRTVKYAFFEMESDTPAITIPCKFYSYIVFKRDLLFQSPFVATQKYFMYSS